MTKDTPAFPTFKAMYTALQDAEGKVSVKQEGGSEVGGMTLQQYAAIQLKVTHPDLPEWLNEMITEARRMDDAQAALTGVMMNASMPEREQFHSSYAEKAHSIANAMKEARNG